MKKALLSLLLAGASAVVLSDAAYAATQTQMEFNYATSDTIGWGNNKMELFDVAVYIPGSTMQGKKITTITVPMRASVATNVSVWLSSELKLHAVNGLRTADPDIMQAEVENQPMITYTLPEPYEVPAEGVYVGYSFNIKSGSISSSDRNNPGRYPVTVSEGATEGGFYIHTTRTYTAWKSNIEAELNYNAYLGVELDGEFYNYALGVAGLTSAKGGLEDSFVTVATLSNYGTESVTSFDYELTTNGTTESKTFTFDQPVAPSFTNTFDLEFALPDYPTPGTYDVELKVTKVNGVANEAPNATATTWADVYSFIPTHRALMEEYTGLWCGYCPRGYIGLMEMNKRHEDFVALSYHNGDDMAVFSNSEYPSAVSGFPAAYIDRVIACDAYYGTYNYDMGVDQTWMERCEVPAPCDVDVEATWNSDSTVVDVKVTTRFQSTYKDAKYRIAYFLVGNGLTNSSWGQSNYYSGNNMPVEYGWDLFKNGSTVKGLVFDDVALWSNNTRGELGSIPAEIPADEILEFAGQITLTDVKNYTKLVANQDISLFTVVAAVVDGKNNEVVNANKCHILASGGQDAIESIADSKATVVSTVYYDLNGRVAHNPAPGVFIKAEKLSDGNVRTSKVVVY